MCKIPSLSSLAFFSTVLFSSAAARAQDSSAAPAAPQALTPPSLLRSVPAEAPEKLDHELTVVLELGIDEEGRIAAANVAESGGAAFDTAALKAVKQFEFSPARQGDTRVSVKIRTPRAKAWCKRTAPIPRASPSSYLILPALATSAMPSRSSSPRIQRTA